MEIIAVSITVAVLAAATLAAAALLVAEVEARMFRGFAAKALLAALAFLGLALGIATARLVDLIGRFFTAQL